MNPKTFDPSRLAVEAFAKQGAELSGEWPLRSFERLIDACHADARPSEADSVRWRAVGETRPVRGGTAEIWLHLSGSTELSLVCQRCLQPVAAPLAFERSFRFVDGEAAAAALDEESEDEDVLALTRALDLHELLEDELLLDQPLVPRHDVCPDPLPASAGDDDLAVPESEHPFAALAALKKPAN
jgi:uncharacterized protein